ncbi:MAG: hypothetical protein JWM11_5010 [Planctomycetaceae bacterium]|nr:hypothetical protein [Planctomycetaceae bacterium]
MANLQFNTNRCIDKMIETARICSKRDEGDVILTDELSANTIPPFLPDGYLPKGVHLCSEPEATFRLGATSRRRRWLIIRLRKWCELGRLVGAKRLLVDGSFVTAKSEPHDVDAVMLLSPDFHDLLSHNDPAAIELDSMFRTRRPEELFAAEDEHDWQAWIEFFSRTREADRRRKGLVEIFL